MAALLEERSRRQEELHVVKEVVLKKKNIGDEDLSLKSLVEGVKRTSAPVEQPIGKRRKL
jgi:hypothetical protein